MLLNIIFILVVKNSLLNTKFDDMEIKFVFMDNKQSVNEKQVKEDLVSNKHVVTKCEPNAIEMQFINEHSIEHIFNEQQPVENHPVNVHLLDEHSIEHIFNEQQPEQQLINNSTLNNQFNEQQQTNNNTLNNQFNEQQQTNNNSVNLNLLNNYLINNHPLEQIIYIPQQQPINYPLRKIYQSLNNFQQPNNTCDTNNNNTDQPYENNYVLNTLLSYGLLFTLIFGVTMFIIFVVSMNIVYISFSFFSVIIGSIIFVVRANSL